MRKIVFLAAFAAVTSATTAFAQNGGPPGEGRGRGPGGRGGMMADRVLLEGITLSEAQQAKLQEIRKADRERAEAQRGQQQGPPPEMQAIREAREKGDTATANKLMAEQRAKMDERRDAQVAAIRAILDERSARAVRRECRGARRSVKSEMGPAWADVAVDRRRCKITRRVQVRMPLGMRVTGNPSSFSK